jgi:simple sugar transport system ATP-binding protein
LAHQTGESRRTGGYFDYPHNATHALAVGDRFVILIHGSVAAEFQCGEKSREEVPNLMAGGEALESLEARL